MEDDAGADQLSVKLDVIDLVPFGEALRYHSVKARAFGDDHAFRGDVGTPNPVK